MNKARNIVVQKILICAAGLIILVGIAWRLAHGQVQNQSNWIPTGIVQQSGTITPGHDVIFAADKTIQDAGQPPIAISGATSNGHVAMFNSLGQLADAGSAPVTILGTPVSGHMAIFNSTTNQITDAGITVPLSGTTAAIGGGLLSVGTSASGTASIPGAIAGKNCVATASDGTNIYALGANIGCTVSSNGVATVNVIALIVLTPPSKTYNVTVLP